MRDGGFTLIELIAVTFLIVLLGGIAIPKVKSVLGISHQSGAARVSGYLQAAYERAVMRHERIKVRFDLTRNTYWAEKYEEPAPVPLLDGGTKLDEAIEAFEDRAAQNPLTDEEKLQKEAEHYKKMEDGTLKPDALPSGVHFKAVYVSSEGKIREGETPWIDFLPSGFSSKAIVYIANDSDDVYSVILPPIGGRARVERGETRPEDA